jgi:hypothetical protein
MYIRKGIGFYVHITVDKYYWENVGEKRTKKNIHGMVNFHFLLRHLVSSPLYHYYGGVIIVQAMFGWMAAKNHGHKKLSSTPCTNQMVALTR